MFTKGKIDIPIRIKGTVKGNQSKQEIHKYSAYNCPSYCTMYIYAEISKAELKNVLIMF